MTERRCSHGFMRSKVPCGECEGNVRPIPRDRPDPGSESEVAQNIEKIILQVAKDLGVSRAEACQSRAGRFITGGVAIHVQAKAEIAKRVKARHGYTQIQIAKAIGVTPGDIWYALKRCG